MVQFTGPLTYIHHTTTPISYSQTQTWVSAYYLRAHQKPHMHPDATLDTSHLEFGTNGVPGGITLNQLSKLSRGLAGEYISPNPSDKGDDTKLDSQIASQGSQKGKKRQYADLTTDSDWEDPDVYAARQGEEEGDIGAVDNYVAAVKRDPRVCEEDDLEVEEKEFIAQQQQEDLTTDFSRGAREQDRKKEKSKSRKEAKKAKRQAEKKDREKERRKVGYVGGEGKVSREEKVEDWIDQILP